MKMWEIFYFLKLNLHQHNNLTTFPITIANISYVIKSNFYKANK